MGKIGLIENAIKSKEQARVEREKEIVENATIQAIGKNKYGNITVEGLTNFIYRKSEEFCKHVLVGAIEFDSTKTGKQYASYEDGYFTYKVSK